MCCVFVSEYLWCIGVYVCCVVSVMNVYVCGKCLCVLCIVNVCVLRVCVVNVCSELCVRVMSGE